MTDRKRKKKIDEINKEKKTATIPLYFRCVSAGPLGQTIDRGVCVYVCVSRATSNFRKINKLLKIYLTNGEIRCKLYSNVCWSTTKIDF